MLRTECIIVIQITKNVAATKANTGISSSRQALGVFMPNISEPLVSIHGTNNSLNIAAPVINNYYLPVTVFLFINRIESILQQFRPVFGGDDNTD